MIFINNKYTNIYFNIIKSAQIRDLLSGYSEKHHIIPKSLGGSNKKDNLVILTAREHFICHWLLTKMVEGDDLRKMKHAIWRMLVQGRDFQIRYKPNSHTYDSLRKKYGSLRKGITTPDEVKQKISKANKGRLAGKNNPMYGNTHTEEARKKISEKAQGRTPWNLGVTHTDKVKQKMSKLALQRTKYKCEHCGVECVKCNYNRWHGDNCRSIVR
jgi:5-methylcytosine-specific restriction endonuclease McrA